MRARRKADEVAMSLLDRIVAGDAPVGSLLPRESDLARRYHVNRSVVREANKLLEVHRLVRPIRRRGTEVLDPNESLTPEVLRAMIVDHRGGIRREMLRHFLEVRALLDAEMSRLAAARRTEGDVARLEEAYEAIRAAQPSPVEFAEAVHDFGLALARATGNPIFVMMAHWHRQIYAHLEPLLGAVRAPTEQNLRAYRALVDAIRDGRAELAGQMVATFHEWATEHILARAGDGGAAEKEERQA